MQTKLRTCSAFLAALALSGCQPAGTPARPTDPGGITGVYTLLKVDGSEVPATVSHDGVPVHVHSGTFAITPEGACVSRTVFFSPDGQEMTRDVHARYERDGSRLTMQWEGAGVTEGEIDGPMFTMDNHGMIFEYLRLGARDAPAPDPDQRGP